MPRIKWSAFPLLLLLSCAIAMGQVGKKRLDSGWYPTDKGFTSMPTQGRDGSSAIYCESSDPTSAFGAHVVVTLNQTAAAPFAVSAWSRSENISGTPDDGYSLYVDLTYTDGSHLWGTISPFECGTHGWQERHVRLVPAKPVKEASVYVLLRRHSGRAWFSDIVFTEGAGANAFDFQDISAPASLSKGNWFIRDVAANTKLVPAASAGSLGLKTVTNVSSAKLNSLEVTNLRGDDRALTLYYCEKFDATGGIWWNTIRNSVPIHQSDCASLASASSGANGLASLYPFAAVTTAHSGRMLAVPPSLGPRIFRLTYNPKSRLLCAAFDVALTHLNRAHPGSADAAVLSLPVDPAYGFRDAARQYYLNFPEAFKNRMPRQGIWLPFTNATTIPHPEDFGIAVHEGDESVASDAKLGILSFRYSEPMTWWMPMAPSIPRTYESAYNVLDKNLQSPDMSTRRLAQAVESSATFGPDGRMNVSFDNQPWANGAVWVLNPNPGMLRRPGMAIQADIVFDPAAAKKRYSTTQLSGEYLDSLEAHEDVLDYRQESIWSSDYPPSFDDKFRTVIPQSYSTYEIAKAMSDQLHAMGKLLMANTTPVKQSCFMPLLDCAGIEVNWLDSGSWTPDNDDDFCYRRTLSYHKPYMLLQNTDFSKFTAQDVAFYFKRCLFYGVYPSFFSADAATHPYWENPALYERDRSLFKSTIPLIRKLNEAGWEPVTLAYTSDPEVYIERYGDSTWTVFNAGASAKSVPIIFEKKFAGPAKDVVTGEAFSVYVERNPVIRITIEPGDCRVIVFSPKHP